MKKGSGVKVIWGTVISLVMLAAFAVSEAAGATYYSSPAGSGSTCSSASPCSLTTGVGKLVAGDTLYLGNGTYNSSISSVPSGTTGNPVTIKALNDGQAVIDGQGVRTPLYIVGSSGAHKQYINIEGIIFQNSSSSVVLIQYADYINLKRLSAYNAANNGNYHAFDLFNDTYILIEDCVAKGIHRTGYDALSCAHITIRRCVDYSKEGSGTYSTGGYGIVIYGTNDSIVENCITIRDTSSSKTYTGINVYMPSGYGNVADNNKVYGSIVFNGNQDEGALGVTSIQNNLSGNILRNNVVFNGTYAFHQSADNSLTAENMTFVNSLSYGYYLHSYYQYYTLDSDFQEAATLENTSFINAAGGVNAIYIDPSDPKFVSMSDNYNNFYGFVSKYGGKSATTTNQRTLNPYYDTATFGNGAYLMVPTGLRGQGQGGADIGAEVLYRYQDGTLTTDPLWPWPMEARILAETGYSVTYEANGGLWKTLNGVYATSPSPTPAPAPTPAPTADTTPPSAPSGLAASVVSSSQINLSWAASSDNVGVAGYKVYRNGTALTTTTGAAYSDTGLSAATTYSYAVSAFDAAGNASPQSNSVSATTQANTAPTTTPNEIIIDDGAPGTSYTGNWQISYGGANPYGADSLYGNAGATYTWKTGLPQSGKYAVYIWWTTYSNRSTSVPVTVFYNKVTKKGSQTASQTVYVNQQQNGGKWNYIGTFSFDAGKGGSVTLSAPNPYPTSYCADAVKFVYTP